MPLGSILATVSAYILIAVLLLSLNLTSSWRWWIKGGTIVVTGIFFAGTFLAIVSLLGWASGARVPDRFTLVSTLVVEPNNFTGEEGAVYLWLSDIDDNNVTSNQPRAYRLEYTEPLADAAEGAQELLDQGEEVEGNVEEAEDPNSVAEAEGGEAGAGAGEGETYYPVEFNLIFNDLPAVVLPDKGAL